ncbi:heterokaryon incompatibility protein-domain-containing protein, partial [Cladorrhinum sp. PSN332]
YTYAPLEGDDSIRLVTILPGNFEDEIRVKIWHASLSLVGTFLPKEGTRLPIDELQETLPPDWKVNYTYNRRYLFIYTAPGNGSVSTTWKHPDEAIDPSLYEEPRAEQALYGQPYEALSYTWGPEGHGWFIYPGPSRLSVRENLASALKHLRHKDQERTMWIDALCINQTDVQERNHQVAQMGQIYNLAKYVVVWLGPATGGSTPAINHLAYIGSQVEVLENYNFMPAPDAQDKDLWKRGPPLSPWMAEAISKLLSRDWFRRVWVVQEVCLARKAKILCGHDQIEWSHFSNGLFTLYLFRISEAVNNPGLQERVKNGVGVAVARSLGPANSLFDRIVSLGGNKSCSDPRDHVYGYLGLFSLGFRSKLPPPQYDLPVSRLYTETTIAHIRHIQRLDILEFCRLTTSIPDLPSWVPDISTTPRVFYNSYQFSAGFSKCWASFASDPPTYRLKATGMRCAVVQRVSGTVSEDAETAVQDVHDFLPAARDLDSAPPYVNGETFRSAYIRTLLQGGETYDGGHKKYERYMTQRNPTEDLVRRLVFLGSIQGRCLVVTEDGYMGFAPRGTESGDMVCILLGLDSGLILRPLSSGQDEFYVVGPCFVYCLDKAIPLLGPLPEPWHLVRDIESIQRYIFHNRDTRVTSDEDPRLEPLGDGWERTRRGRTADDPGYFQRYRNRITGEEMTSDPRMTPDALRARGVKLEEFTLI